MAWLKSFLYWPAVAGLFGFSMGLGTRWETLSFTNALVVGLLFAFVVMVFVAIKRLLWWVASCVFDHRPSFVLSVAVGFTTYVSGTYLFRFAPALSATAAVGFGGLLLAGMSYVYRQNDRLNEQLGSD